MLDPLGDTSIAHHTGILSRVSHDIVSSIGTAGHVTFLYSDCEHHDCQWKPLGFALNHKGRGISSWGWGGGGGGGGGGQRGEWVGGQVGSGRSIHILEPDEQQGLVVGKIYAYLTITYIQICLGQC